MDAYTAETLVLANERSAGIKEQFVAEVNRLLRSGGVDTANHSRGLLFGVALENIADDFLRGERKSGAYRNLKHF